MYEDNLNKEIEILFDKHGKQNVIDAVSRKTSKNHTLSIISNDGMHRQPSELILGEKFIFSSGTIDTSTDKTMSDHLEKCCKSLAEKLREKRWTEVQLFFSGHSLLSAYAKLTVYRVTHLNTIDYGFFSDSGYRRVSFNLRPQLLAKGS